MADFITLARNFSLAKNGSSLIYFQTVVEAVDVSAYDSIDFQCSVITDNAAGVTIDIMTSMLNKIDDIGGNTANIGPSWYSIGNRAFTPAAGQVKYDTFSVPGSTGQKPMLRYIRYQITLVTGTSAVQFSIEGLARRGLRVG